ncbi:hypothetical protein BDR05DRAFT_141421 [Suillus weaverae]|nr:hypothetical protein BDR05DRAFT_141421 [Suillus weaverae]
MRYTILPLKSLSSSQSENHAKSLKAVFSYLFSALLRQTISLYLPQTQVSNDPTEVYTSSVILTMFNADVDVKLDKKLQSELH